MASNDQSGNQNLCPHCKQPLSPGVKFCESCGAMIEPPATCPHCGDTLSPGVKFCESCGKAVAAPVPAPAAATTSVPAPEPGPVPPQEEPAGTAAAPPASPEPSTPEPEPEKTPEPEPQPEPEPAETNTEPAEPQKPVGPEGTATAPSATTPGMSQKTLIVAGVVGLIVIAALAWFVILPMLSGAGSAPTGNGAALPATTSATTSGTSATSTQTASAVSFETQPTQRMPTNLEVTYQVERDTRNGKVTVTFAGGPGLNGIAQTLIRVTTPDGEVIEKSWKPSQAGDSVVVQGTVEDNRVEVITSFYNGNSYRNFDEVFEYKIRN